MTARIEPRAASPAESVNATTPVTDSSLPTRERLLRSAATILAEKGYGQTRLSDVAALAGVKSPAVYYHFSSRDELVAASLRAGQQRVHESVRTALERTADAPWTERLGAAIAAHLHIALDLPNFAKAVTRNAGSVPGPIRDVLQTASNAYHDTWRELIHQGIDSGDVDPNLDPGVGRMLTIGALNWATEWWPGAQDRSELVFVATALIRSGLAGRTNLPDLGGLRGPD